MLLSRPHIRKAAPVLMGPLSDYCTGTNVNARAMCSVPGAANNKKKAVHKKEKGPAQWPVPPIARTSLW
jgi:hypothetical protein